MQLRPENHSALVWVKRTTWFWLVLSITLMSFAGFALSKGKDWLRPAQAQSSRPAIAQPTENFEVEIVTLTPDGFTPQEITRPKGKVLLVFHNRTGLQTPVTFRLDRETGEHLKEVKAEREKRRIQELFDLTPGKYQVSEASHPEWVCQITITAK